MSNPLINDLHNRLDALFASYKQVREENRFLHEIIAKLKVEQSALQKNNQLAADKVKTIIETLKKHYE